MLFNRGYEPRTRVSSFHKSSPPLPHLLRLLLLALPLLPPLQRPRQLLEVTLLTPPLFLDPVETPLGRPQRERRGASPAVARRSRRRIRRIAPAPSLPFHVVRSSIERFANGRRRVPRDRVVQPQEGFDAVPHDVVLLPRSSLRPPPPRRRRQRRRRRRRYTVRSGRRLPVVIPTRRVTAIRASNVRLRRGGDDYAVRRSLEQFLDEFGGHYDDCVRGGVR